MNNLGERLYNLRMSREMSQGDLAEKLDVSRQTISKWENNMSIPELDKIIALSDLFSVSIDHIVKGENTAEVFENPVDEEKQEASYDKPYVKTVTVDPTKRMINSLSVGLGAVYFVTVIINTISLASTVINGFAGAIVIESVISMLINIFYTVCLLSGKLNLLSASYGIRAVYSVLIMIKNGSFGLVGALNIAAYILIVFMYFKGNKKNSRFLFLLGSMLFAAAFVLNGASMANSFIDYGMTWRNLIISLFNTMIGSVPYLIVNIGSAFLIHLRADPKPTYELPENTYPENSDMYVGIVKHILLTIFTFGIYDFYWVYKTTENLNVGSKEIQSGTKKLLLCIFVPFYRWYWFYAQSKRLEKLMREKDMNISEIAVVTLILAVFVPVVAASAFLQLKINEYAQK